MSKLRTFPDTVVLVGTAKLQELLDAGARVHELDPKGRTALFRTCRVGQTEKVLMLLAAGADPNAIDKRGESPLQSAARYGHLDCVRALLKAGAEINYCPPPSLTDYSESALCSAVRQSPAAAHLLLEAGADPNAVTATKHYPLMAACWAGDVETVRLLLTHHAKVSIADCNRHTPLHAAVQARNPDLVKLLLDAGADPNRKDKFGQTPVFAAIDSDDKKCIPVLQNLLAAKPNLSVRNSSHKRTPLEWAIFVCAEDAAELLRAAGSPPSRFKDEDESDETETTNVKPDIRQALVTPEDETLARQARVTVPSLVAYLGWRASPRHWVLLRAAERRTRIVRLAYSARGCTNRPAGQELEDGPRVLGEPYRAAVDRFIQEGLLQRAAEIKEVELAFDADELKALAKQHGLQLSGTKEELAARLHATLPSEMFRPRLDMIGGYYQLTLAGRQVLDCQTSHLEDVIDRLRSQLLDALRNNKLALAICFARALQLMLDAAHHRHRDADLPQPKHIAAARFFLRCTLPAQLQFPPRVEISSRIILAAHALGDEWNATWQTWDKSLKSPTTKKGVEVPLSGLSSFVLEKGEYFRGYPWEDELSYRPMFPDDAVHARWRDDQSELRARLGEQVVIFGFERLY